MNNYYTYLFIIMLIMSIFTSIGIIIHGFNLKNTTMLALLIISTFTLTGLFLIYSGDYKQYPHLLFINLPGLALLAPTWFLFVQASVNMKKKFYRKDFMHFVPIIIILLVEIPLIIQHGPEKVRLQLQYTGLVYYLNIFVRVYIAGYLAYTTYPVFMAYKQKRIKGKDAALLIIVIYASISILTCKLITIFNNMGTALFGVQLVFMITGYLTLYICFLSNLIRPLKNQIKTKIAKKHMDTLQIVEIDKKITYLMEDEKLFCDEDMTLERLSKITEIPRHRLSGFLNSHYGYNFNTFLNNYRITYARQLITEDPARRNIDIAFDVGFNSYSPFFNAFKKFVGCSPDEFRQKIISQQPGSAK